MRVVCGPTGSGKSLLLHALGRQGAQVLDLEALANHRGSVLGLVPGARQPTQKHFDTLLWDALRRLDPARPVFVESESKKIGDLRVPEALIQRMRASPCLWLELGARAPGRVAASRSTTSSSPTPRRSARRLDALRVLRGSEVDRGLAGIGARRAHGRGRARAAGRPLRPDLPAVDAPQLRRRGSPWLRLEWDGSAPSLGRGGRGQAIAAPRP